MSTMSTTPTTLNGPRRLSRVLRFHETGEPLNVLREERIEVPRPPQDQVRVRVLATGLNPADWELCRSFMPGSLPRGIGCDVAGIVDAVGQGVDAPAAQVGDVVFGTADFAGQASAGAAEMAILNAWSPVPDGLDPIHAATLPMVVQTAAWTLEVMDLAPGATLLVHGAGAMVGYAAVQIALRHGARVIATAGPTFTEDLESFGANVTGYGPGMVDRVRTLTKGQDVDFVLDTPRPSPGTLPCLISLAGGDARRVMTISNHDEARSLGARVNIDEFRPGLSPLTGLLAEYADLAGRGEFRLPIAQAYPFDEWREAVELSLSGSPHGKVVLLPTPSNHEEASA
jgi:NADPH:quinone reductase-like Zn-dependent oxidoreductase